MKSPTGCRRSPSQRSRPANGRGTPLPRNRRSCRISPGMAPEASAASGGAWAGAARSAPSRAAATRAATHPARR